MRISLVLPDRKDLTVDLNPSEYFPDLMTRASRWLTFSVVFFLPFAIAVDSDDEQTRLFAGMHV
jgi:hypothetical protein